MEGVLPIAETFHSLQGEGQWVGTPMHFIRLAGCNVGRPARALKLEPFPILHTGREAMACTSWDGRTFPCDTDYRHMRSVPIKQLIDETWEKHICVTGGEPLLHYDLIEGLFALAERGLTEEPIMVHIETSGTIKPKSPFTSSKLLMPGYWVTCSPKIGALDDMIRRADELKLLVDEEFNIDRLTPAMREHKNLWLCPINGVGIDPAAVNRENVDRCIALCPLFPNARVSVQLHKLLGVR